MNGLDFEVSDNVTTEVKIPVNFSKTTGSIKDYLVLKEIWEALGGPAIPEKNQKGWRYSGVTYPLGTNWNFDKDIDYGAINQVSNWMPKDVSWDFLSEHLLLKAIFPNP